MFKISFFHMQIIHVLCLLVLAIGRNKHIKEKPNYYFSKSYPYQQRILQRNSINQYYTLLIFHIEGHFRVENVISWIPYSFVAYFITLSSIPKFPKCKIGSLFFLIMIPIHLIS